MNHRVLLRTMPLVDQADQLISKKNGDVNTKCKIALEAHASIYLFIIIYLKPKK